MARPGCVTWFVMARVLTWKLNMETLKERRSHLQLKFGLSGLKHNKLNDLLPKNEKCHEMQTRNIEHYKVDFANTERLRKSSIISIQTMLNDDYRQKKKRKCG